jgi:hypothetical protein
MAILCGMTVLAMVGCCLLTTAGGRRSSVDSVGPVVSTIVHTDTRLPLDDLLPRLSRRVTLWDFGADGRNAFRWRCKQSRVSE